MSQPQQFLLLLLLLLPLLPGINGDAIDYSNCTSSFHCGDIEIRYPFWLTDGNIAEYCGYPYLGLRCNNENESVLHLENGDYYVEEINYDDKTIRLVDTDLSEGDCPKLLSNVTLPDIQTLVYSGSDLNLTFLFNCSSSFTLPRADPLSCLSAGALQSYFLEQNLLPAGLDWFRYCERSVVVPVMRSAWNDVLNLGGYSRVLQQGFRLNWNSYVDCRGCEETDGYCGYVFQTQNFVCLCRNGTHDGACPGAKFKGVRNKIILEKDQLRNHQYVEEDDIHAAYHR